MITKNSKVRVFPKGNEIGVVKSVVGKNYYVEVNGEVCSYEQSDLREVIERTPAPTVSRDTSVVSTNGNITIQNSEDDLSIDLSNMESIFRNVDINRPSRQPQHRRDTPQMAEYVYVNDDRVANAGSQFAIQLLDNQDTSQRNLLKGRIIKADGQIVQLTYDMFTVIDQLFITVNSMPTSLQLNETIVIEYVSRNICEVCGEHTDDCSCNTCPDCGETNDNCTC